MTEIVIARDFTKYPGGRYRRHGAGSGEEFRDRFLVPALHAGGEVKVVFDGTSGYPASFIEEAFGGLVRSGLNLETLRRNLILISSDSDYQAYVDQAWDYIVEQAARPAR